MIGALGEWQTEIQSLFDSYHNPDGTDKNNVKTGRYLYPIPLNQLNVTPGLYKQMRDIKYIIKQS